MWFWCNFLFQGFDMLFYSLVCFTSTHFKLLQGAFATIKEKAIAQTGGVREIIPGELQERMYDELRSCIRHLQLILE